MAVEGYTAKAERPFLSPAAKWTHITGGRFPTTRVWQKMRWRKADVTAGTYRGSGRLQRLLERCALVVLKIILIIADKSCKYRYSRPSITTCWRIWCHWAVSCDVHWSVFKLRCNARRCMSTSELKSLSSDFSAEQWNAAAVDNDDKLTETHQ